jgi:pyruvate dehydrogenase E2 component (dihydrolipoamide acetyltransferase)
MALSVVMPALEMAQETGTVISWFKQEGDQVVRGERLLEVETDKAVVEIEAAGDGLLAGVTAKPGDVVPVGRTIAWLLQPGETVPTVAADPVPTGRRMAEATPVQTSQAGDRGGSGASAAGATAPRLSPKARRLAQEHGVDLATVRGSGPGGEVLSDDILAAVAAAEAASGASDAVPGGPTQPRSSISRLMAERTTQSWATAPHFFVTRDVDATPLNAARDKWRLIAERDHGVRLTHTDLLVALVGRALRKHPRINASWSANGVVAHPEINVAIAVSVEQGVVTAVVRQTDTVTPAEIAARRHELVERARLGRLLPSDITGATFTISNLGMFGVDAFTAIIVPPQAAILAVGTIRDRVVAVDGVPAVRPMLSLTLSSDHRVVDGAGAAAFLKDVVGWIDNAAQL